MHYLFSKLNKLANISKNRPIFLFLDFDGTLSPIAAKPNKAIFPKKTKHIVAKLAKNKCFKVIIISGRALQDIKNKIGIKDIIYVGNHGLEIDGPKINFKAQVSATHKKMLNKIKGEIRRKVSKIKGVILEDKKFSIVVHYRLVDKRQIPRVKTIFHEAIITYLVKNQIKIKLGKMFLEARCPSPWDKGRVVLWLLSRQHIKVKNKILPIYIGDDSTDEDAFKALKNKGLTIFVGKPKKSFANYYLKSTRDARKFLQHILKLKEREKVCPN